MTQPITLSVRMFGAFRKYYEGTLAVQVPAGVAVPAAKAAIAAALRQQNPAFDDDDLIAKSALADHSRILGPDETISAAAALAMLPPVCGG